MLRLNIYLQFVQSEISNSAASHLMQFALNTDHEWGRWETSSWILRNSCYWRLIRHLSSECKIRWFLSVSEILILLQSSHTTCWHLCYKSSVSFITRFGLWCHYLHLFLFAKAQGLWENNYREGTVTCCSIPKHVSMFCFYKGPIKFKSQFYLSIVKSG